MSSIARPDSNDPPDLAPRTDEEITAIRAAGQLLSEGRIGEIAPVLEPWLDHATFPDAFTLLAQALASSGDLSKAEAVLRRAEERFPDDPRVWKSLAVIFRTLMRPADELPYRRKLVYLIANPSLSAYVRLAEASAAVIKSDPQAGQGDLRYIARKVGALPVNDADNRAERLAVAQSLYQVDELQDEAFGLYSGASPATERQEDLQVTWLRLQEWCDHAKLPIRRAEELGQPGYRPMLAELSRVAVQPGFQWMPLLDESGVAISGFNTRRLVYHASDLNSPLLLHAAPRRSVVRIARDLPTLPGPALLLGGLPQYYHQTIEHLGTLAVAETLGVPPNIPLVVNHDLAPFQLEQFALLGIAEDRLIRVRPDAPVRFERLWIASRPVVGGRWVDPLMPEWYRRRLGLLERQGRRRLYLSRAGTDRRRITNEAALVAMLTTLGFEVVKPETLGVRAQIELFADASHIVSPSGAALTNMIFAPPGTQVVSIYHKAFAAVDVDLYFDALAKACGHVFAPVTATAVAAHASGRTIDADIEVDLDRLRVALGGPLA